MVKSVCSAGDPSSIPRSGRSPRRKWQPTLVFLPGKSHGQRSLVGYSPWGRKESNRTERLHSELAAAAAESLQSCPTLCDPIDGSSPSSPVPGILQARTLEWVAISFSNAWKWKVKVKSLGRVQLFMTPWTAAHQAPPSMGFSRQEYWSGVPLPSPFSIIVINKSIHIQLNTNTTLAGSPVGFNSSTSFTSESLKQNWYHIPFHFWKNIFKIL